MGLENIKNVGVIGAGLMGAQIAELVSKVGKYSVTMWDLKDEFVKGGFDAIESRLS